MAEKFDVAAKRHLRVAELLERSTELDDAGYHFGLAGETAIKYALVKSGLKGQWSALVSATTINRAIMATHMPILQEVIHQARTIILAFGSNRYATLAKGELTSAAFQERFAGWRQTIRYADTHTTPATKESCTSWKDDAIYLIRKLEI